MTQCVPETTSSRVSWIRPGWPRAGFSPRRSAARKMRRAGACAPAGLSRTMYSASSSGFRSAMASHLACIAIPLAQDLPHLIIAGKVFSVGLVECAPNLLHLPFVQIHEIKNGLAGKKRLRSLRRFGQMHQALFQRGFQADRHGGGHGRSSPCASVHTVTRQAPAGAVVQDSPTAPGACAGTPRTSRTRRRAGPGCGEAHAHPGRSARALASSTSCRRCPSRSGRRRIR